MTDPTDDLISDLYRRLSAYGARVRELEAENGRMRLALEKVQATASDETTTRDQRNRLDDVEEIARAALEGTDAR